MTQQNLGGKLFAYKVKYTQKDGIENPDYSLFAGKNVKPKFNGNITEVDWRSVESIGENPSLTPKRYGYVYDASNRLTAGYYQNPYNPNSRENIESLAYDVNGNITNLYRTSVLQNGIANTIDNLDYTYKGNQAIKIKDNTGNRSGYEGISGGPITYDVNGNMNVMLDKHIDNIDYNYLNLPNKLSLSFPEENRGTLITTLYGADGTKLRKVNASGFSGFGGISTTTEVTDYLDGFQYLNKTSTNPGGGSSEMLSKTSETDYAFEQQAFSSTFPIDTDPTINPPLDPGITPFPEKTPDLQFFPTAEGFYDYKNDQYIYQYQDHLGNVRVSFARNSAGAIELKDNNDYYPFGMNHLKTGTSYYGVGNYQNYKYNGKELQETGMYDYGARMYMADIGRWGVIDPKGAEFPAWSPYNYSLNNPIRFVDPDGMAPNDIVFINNRGVEVHRIKSDTQFKTYIQASTNASSNPAQSTAGWKSVPMPNTIQHRPQSNEDVSGAAYQENDYQIAARTGYFNQAKNSGQLNLVTEGGNPIPTEATKDIPDLDPTLVKAVTVQESNAGTTGITDIMQANVPGDWSKMKSSYQLTKGEKTSETNSLYAGTRVLATKGFKGGVSVDKSGKVTYKFQGWAKAVEAYNGGGTAGYQKSVLQMQQESKKPKPSDY